MNGIMLKWVCILVVAFSVSSCSRVTIRPYGGERDVSKASFQITQDYYFWGLKGELEVNVDQFCQERRVMQMQSVSTLSNWLMQMVTLGIYFPRTAKIWCERI